MKECLLCPLCGGEVVSVVKPVTWHVGDKRRTFLSVKVEVCSKCHEEFYDLEDAKRMDEETDKQIEVHSAEEWGTVKIDPANMTPKEREGYEFFTDWLAEQVIKRRLIREADSDGDSGPANSAVKRHDEDGQADKAGAGQREIDK